MLALLQAFDELENATLSVLAPNIRDTFHVSDGVIVFISAASAAFLALGAAADGLARRPRAGARRSSAGRRWCSRRWCSRAASRPTRSRSSSPASASASRSRTRIPVQGSLDRGRLSDRCRGRVNATVGGAVRLAAVLSPVIVGGIAALAGGREGWRWAYLAAGACRRSRWRSSPSACPSRPRSARDARRARRGHRRRRRDADLARGRVRPAATGSARSGRCCSAFAAMGFGLFTGPVLQNLYLDRHFHLGTFGRGVVAHGDGRRRARRAAVRREALRRVLPARPGRRAAPARLRCIVPVAVLLPIQYVMPNDDAVRDRRRRARRAAPHRVHDGRPDPPVGRARTGCAGMGIGARLALRVLRRRHRSARCSPRSSPTRSGRAARGPADRRPVDDHRRAADHAQRVERSRHDLSLVVAELREELDEQRRQQRASPRRSRRSRSTPIDFSYGHVQVLFDVGFEVRRGEVLALLGTNGAGKSTILRVIAGLGTPSRGVVRLHGTTITYVAPEQRVKYGIRLLPGGKGVFPQMTIRENLEMGAYIYRDDHADRDRRIARVLDLFDVLARPPGRRWPASLSGGQQQMLALADHAPARPRRAAHRRALARPVADRRASSCSPSSSSSSARA